MHLTALATYDTPGFLSKKCPFLPYGVQQERREKWVHFKCNRLVAFPHNYRGFWWNSTAPYWWKSGNLHYIFFPLKLCESAISSLKSYLSSFDRIFFSLFRACWKVRGYFQAFKFLPWTDETGEKIKKITRHFSRRGAFFLGGRLILR